MNRKEEERIAKKYNRQGEAYVKAEYKGGKNELMVAGDMIALMRVAERIISRVSDISGQSFINTWLAIRDLHNVEVKSQVVQNGVMIPYAKGGEEE